MAWLLNHRQACLCHIQWRVEFPLSQFRTAWRPFRQFTDAVRGAHAIDISAGTYPPNKRKSQALFFIFRQNWHTNRFAKICKIFKGVTVARAA